VSGADEARTRQRAVWSAAAEGWIADRDAIGGPAAFLTDRLIELAGITPGYAVLDVACGGGDPALPTARVVGPQGRVVAVDFVPQMVEGARELADELGIRNVEFCTIDNEIDLGVSGPFDAVTCRFGLMFMPDPVNALRAWRALLRPEGRIAVCTWATMPMMGAVREIVARHAAVPEVDPNAPGVLALPSPEKLHDIFEAAGYRDVVVETARVPLFADLPPDKWWDTMARSAGPIVALLAAQTEATRQAIRADGIRLFGERHPSGIVAEFGEALVTGAERDG